MFLLFLIPQTIEVRVTGLRECEPVMSYYTETVDLKEYVKGVLPNEWLPKWDLEALRAGAVAVKQFGVVDYRESGYVWDCTWDQVYDPSRRTPQTDQAVEDTWDIWMLDDDYKLVKTYYNADKWGCAEQSGECMSQWGSQKLARQGLLSRDILLRFYTCQFVKVGVSIR